MKLISKIWNCVITQEGKKLAEVGGPSTNLYQVIFYISSLCLWNLFQIGMDETNKRINNMVVEGLEKAGLATDTKLSGSCCSLIHPLDKALKSSPCQLWVKCTCAYPGARVSLRQTENGLRTTTDANNASCCHDFGRQTGCVQRKGLRVQCWLFWNWVSTKSFQLCHAFVFDLQRREVNRWKYKTWVSLLP